MFSAFKPVSKAQWFARIEQDLKAKPLSDLMVELEGVELSPFYHREDQPPIAGFAYQASKWEIGEDIAITGDLEQCNHQLLDALENGVDAPRLVIDTNLTDEQLSVVLKGVMLEGISTQFYLKGPGTNLRTCLDHFLRFIGHRGLDVKTIRAGFYEEKTSLEDERLPAPLMNEVKNAGSGIKVLTVSGLGFFSEEEPVSELVQTLTAAERLLHHHSFVKDGVSAINDHLQFSFGLGKNYFLQVAKLRAFQMLWANIMKAYQIDGSIPPVEAHIAASSQTENVNTNMIAATTQAMSAIIGGAQRLTLLPSDAFTGKHSGFSRRIARNVQHILKMESHFEQVVDPIAGSYFVENLTQQLAAKAWEEFVRRQSPLS